MRGARVQLVRCGDPHTRLKPGALGTVRRVDALGTVHVTWDDGHSLGLCPDDGDDYIVLDAAVYVAWELGPKLEAQRVEPRTWNGWVVPVMNRRQVEALIARQPAHEYPDDCDLLSFDGDTLIVTAPRAPLGPLYEEGGESARIEPRDNEYIIDLGWTFRVCED